MSHSQHYFLQISKAKNTLILHLTKLSTHIHILFLVVKIRFIITWVEKSVPSAISCSCRLVSNKFNENSMQSISMKMNDECKSSEFNFFSFVRKRVSNLIQYFSSNTHTFERNVYS